MIDSDSEIGRDLDAYIRFGGKASGGAGDNACGAWIEQRLGDLGYASARQMLAVPCTDTGQSGLATADATVPVLHQAMTPMTPDGGIAAPLRRLPLHGDVPALAGAIALIDLPYRRWSSAVAAEIRDGVARATDAGALAAILVTNGPSGSALALNTPGDRALFTIPVAILAPTDSGPIHRAAEAGAAVRLMLTGRAATRPAYNVVGTMDRGRKRWVILSTPRSGWFTCAGERGPGLAVWLSLARWAAARLDDFDIMVVCSTGHEYENLGASRFLAEMAPRPAATRLWLHLGANVAARDWHLAPPSLLAPLPGADPQRFLGVPPAWLDIARAAFSGLPGLEAPYPNHAGAKGELAGILGAGYGDACGIFGAHRLHHSRDDDARCVSAPLAADVARACRRFLTAALELSPPDANSRSGG